MKRVLIVLAILALVAAGAFAQVPKAMPGGVPPSKAEKGPFKGADVIGERTVNFGGDVDIIPIGEDKGRFRKIGIEIDGNDVEIRRMIIEFMNGDKYESATSIVFQEGDRSRGIDLPGDKRFIRTITLYYRTVGSMREGRGQIKIYGID
jgi:hypothetical protein